MVERREPIGESKYIYLNPQGEVVGVNVQVVLSFISPRKTKKMLQKSLKLSTGVKPSTISLEPYAGGGWYIWLESSFRPIFTLLCRNSRNEEQLLFFPAEQKADALEVAQRILGTFNQIVAYQQNPESVPEEVDSFRFELSDGHIALFPHLLPACLEGLAYPLSNGDEIKELMIGFMIAHHSALVES